MYANNIEVQPIEDAQIDYSHPIPVAVSSFIQPYNEGYNCAYIVGSLDDWDVSPVDGYIEKRGGILEKILLQEYALIPIRYCLSGGIYYDMDLLGASDRRTLENVLSSHSLSPNSLTSNQYQDDEFTRILRGIFSLTRSNRQYQLSDGRTLKLCIIVEFSEHLIPCSADASYMTDPQKMAIELVKKLCNSMELRKSKHFIVFNDETYNLPNSLRRTIPIIHLPFPTKEEKEFFAERVLNLYKNATTEQGLTPTIIANLSSNTGNTSLERLVRKSHKTQTPLTAKAVSKRKEEDVVAMSEGTLAVLPTERVKGVKLVGRNIEVPLNVVLREADNVKNSNPLSISNLLLVGAPGVAKTDMVSIAALRAGLPAYTILSPKGSLVGETERKVRVQNAILKSHKCLSFSDEFSKAIPTGTQSSNLDSGASDSIIATFQEVLSDKSRAGQQLFVATTNTIWEINGALLDRFEVVPVLMPLEEDYPLILSTITNQIFPHLNTSEKDVEVVNAANLFHSKFASPRHIVKALRVLGSHQSNIKIQDLMHAANNLNTQNNQVNAIYCELSALQACNNNQFLPWFGKNSYNFPNHIRNVIDSRTGEPIQSKITQEMNALKPYINI